MTDNTYWQLEPGASCCQRVRSQCRRGTLIYALVTSTFIYGLSIGGLITEHLDPDETCIGNIQGVGLTYREWIRIYAVSNICIWSFLMISDRFRSNRIVDYVVKWTFIFNLIYQIAWYVVACIFFFNRKTEDCHAGAIYQYIFAVIFLQLGVLGLLIVGANHVDSSEIEQSSLPTESYLTQDSQVDGDETYGAIPNPDALRDDPYAMSYWTHVQITQV